MNPSYRWLMALLPLFLSLLAPAQPPRQVADRIAAVETSLIPYVPIAGKPGWNLRERMHHHKVAGLSIAVIHNYQIDWIKSYGLADTITHRPVTNETLFSAGSISKLVTAMAALKLVEQGKLSLDTPINQYLTSWKLAENEFTRKTPVTLRMLLSHRGGTSQSAYFGFTPDRKPLPSVVDILSGKPGTDSRAVVVNSEPDKEFRYSGGGYLVVQLAMMDVTGKNFVALTDELLFKPLGLRRITFAQPLPPSLAPTLSWAYSTNSWFKSMPYVYPQQAPAGLHTTARDLAALLLDLQNSYRGQGKILSQASVQAMFTPLALVSDGFMKEQMGLGAFLLQNSQRTDEASRFFNHQGVNAGFIADATGSLTGGNGLVVLMNNNNGANELGKEIRRAVASVYKWTGFLPKPLVIRTLPDSLLNAYVGRYQRSTDEVITLRRAGNLLIETINNGDDIYCVPIGHDTLAFTDYTAKAYLSRGQTGRVDSLRIEWQAKPMPRLPEGVYLPNELLRLGRLSEAIEGYRAMNLTVYQLTYMAYDLMSSRPSNMPAAGALLNLAQERFPKEGIVYARFGDLYQKQNNRSKALAAYQMALQLDSTDQDSKAKLAILENR